MSMQDNNLNETLLQDDYPVYWDYLYVADGRVIRSDIQGTIRDLKRDLKAEIITCCDIEGRRKLLKANNHERNHL